MSDTGLLEHKYCPVDSGLAVTEGHRIEGYASLFNLVDQGGDVVVPGAYAAALERLTERGGRIKMLWQHNPSEPIGVWDEVGEDATGLFVKGRLLTEVARAREAAALLTAGAIDGLSIGYRTRRAERGEGGRRLLKELELWEVSLVTFPMLPEARVGAKDDSAEAGLERSLAAAFDAARREIATSGTSHRSHDRRLSRIF